MINKIKRILKMNSIIKIWYYKRNKYNYFIKRNSKKNIINEIEIFNTVNTNLNEGLIM